MENVEKKQKLKDNFINILQAESAYGSISKACSIVGLSRQTVYDWQKIDNEFEAAVKQAVINGKSLLCDLAEEALVGRIKSGDTTSIIFTLKSLNRDTYGEKNDKELEAETKQNELRKQAAPKTPKEARALARIYIRTSYYMAKKFQSLSEDEEKKFDELFDLLTEGRYSKEDYKY